MPLKIALEYDDWSPVNHRFEKLESFRDHFPGFKVTLFTVPLEIRYGEPCRISDPKYKEFVKACADAHRQGWMYFALHGLTHLPMEFAEIGADEAVKRVIVGQKMMKAAGLPLMKVFKAPNWKISKDSKIALKKKGWKVVEDLYYHWNLKDERPSEAEVKGKIIIAHGHVQDGDGCYNGIDETAHQIMSLPSDTKFYSLDKVL